MRVYLLTLVCALSASAAAASSIENMATGRNSGNNSVQALSCASCPPVQPKVRKADYVVPSVEHGTERVELKKIGNEMKLVRTEAWLGGSPIVFVTKASDEAIKAAEAGNDTTPLDTQAKASMDAIPAKATADASFPPAIDTSATTASLAGMTAAEVAPKAPPEATSREFDPDALELRLK